MRGSDYEGEELEGEEDTGGVGTKKRCFAWMSAWCCCQAPWMSQDFATEHQGPHASKILEPPPCDCWCTICRLVAGGEKKSYHSPKPSLRNVTAAQPRRPRLHNPITSSALSNVQKSTSSVQPCLQTGLPALSGQTLREGCYFVLVAFLSLIHI